MLNNHIGKQSRMFGRSMVRRYFAHKKKVVFVESSTDAVES